MRRCCALVLSKWDESSSPRHSCKQQPLTLHLHVDWLADGIRCRTPSVLTKDCSLWLIVALQKEFGSNNIDDNVWWNLVSELLDIFWCRREASKMWLLHLVSLTTSAISLLHPVFFVFLQKCGENTSGNRCLPPSAHWGTLCLVAVWTPCLVAMLPLAKLYNFQI